MAAGFGRLPTQRRYFMSKYKKCKLLGNVAPLPPGSVLSVYGHKWTMDKDGNAYGNIHVDFLLFKVNGASGGPELSKMLKQLYSSESRVKQYGLSFQKKWD